MPRTSSVEEPLVASLGDLSIEHERDGDNQAGLCHGQFRKATFVIMADEKLTAVALTAAQECGRSNSAFCGEIDPIGPMILFERREDAPAVEALKQQRHFKLLDRTADREFSQQEGLRQFAIF